MIFVVEFLLHEGVNDTSFESWEPQYLNNMLTVFYLYGKDPGGGQLAPEHLQTFRRALSLYLTSEINSSAIQVSIVLDEVFRSSNECLARIVADRGIEPAKQSGACVKDMISGPENPPIISKEDIEKLYSSGTFSDKNPVSLLHKVWFDITYYFCQRAMPSSYWKAFKKKNLSLQSDEFGVFYTSENNVMPTTEIGTSHMYATPEDPVRCPVRNLSLYLSKLSPKCEELLQIPRAPWSCRLAVWYMPLGLDDEMLDEMMARISRRANLSRIYTNDSVAATANYHRSQL